MNLQSDHQETAFGSQQQNLRGFVAAGSSELQVPLFQSSGGHRDIPAEHAGAYNHSPVVQSTGAVIGQGHSHALPAPALTPGQQQFRWLKVEDALSYLDQLKFQCRDQPEVYNEFLDIMRDYKSRSIDTRDVIIRVSQVLKGHPDLIMGFNNFLPLGYRIEVQTTQVAGRTTTGRTHITPRGFSVQTFTITQTIPRHSIRQLKHSHEM